jgi:hypothetical protein
MENGRGQEERAMRWCGAVVLASVMAAMCVSDGAQVTMTVEAPPPPLIMFGGIEASGPMPGIKGQPYSLVEKTTQVRTLSDGTVMTTHLEKHEMRDSEGRTRTEMGTVKDGRFEVQNVFLVEPAAKIYVDMTVNGKTTMVTHFPEPKPVIPPTPEQEARARMHANRKEHPVLPPSYEELQPETIAGVYATGRRRTLIIPVGREGNDRDIHVVEDTWTSPDLKVRMRSTRDDPRSGKITMEVTEIEQNEPDPALFQIPADYKVTDQMQ